LVVIVQGVGVTATHIGVGARFLLT
jgi:hypothetical protein